MADAQSEEHRPRDHDTAAGAGGDAPEGEGQPGEGGAESYGGDSDAGPSMTEEEIERGLKRDQAEG